MYSVSTHDLLYIYLEISAKAFFFFSNLLVKETGGVKVASKSMKATAGMFHPELGVDPAKAAESFRLTRSVGALNCYS